LQQTNELVVNKSPLDLFTTLNRISVKNREYYNDLDDESKKAFMPLVIQRWLTGTKDPRQVYFVNALVNPYVFQLHKHKELLYYLMTICGSGQSKRLVWKKAKGKHDTSKPVTIDLIKRAYHYNTVQAKDALQLLSKSDILDLAEDFGLQSEDVSKIKKELNSK
jgi:hypothetical protein